MTSDHTRNDVWYALLDIDREMRYCNEKSRLFEKKQTRIRFALLAVSTTGVITLASELPWFVQAIISAVIGIIVAFDFSRNFGKKSVVLNAITIEYGRLENEWRELWNDVNQDDATEAEIGNKSTELKQRKSIIDALAGDNIDQLDEKLNEKCARETYQVMANEFNVEYTS